MASLRAAEDVLRRVGLIARRRRREEGRRPAAARDRDAVVLHLRVDAIDLQIEVLLERQRDGFVDRQAREPALRLRGVGALTAADARPATAVPVVCARTGAAPKTNRVAAAHRRRQNEPRAKTRLVTHC